jgi:hypothetical protein
MVEWSKTQDLSPCGVTHRGFKSHSYHTALIFMPFTQIGLLQPSHQIGSNEGRR